MKTSRVQTLALLGLGCSLAFPAAAAPRTSDAYVLSAETVNSAGSRTASLAYSHEGDLDMTSAAAASASYAQGGGFSSTLLDSTAPDLVVPISIVLKEAAGPDGARVTFTMAASDDEGGALTPVSTPASGSLFALGDTPVSVTVADLSGNPATASFIVRVQDTIAPVVTPPDDVMVVATSSAGATVNFPAASATDAVGVTSLTYSQASGTTFPIGTTVVTATARDLAQHATSATFRVTVSATIVALPAATGSAVEG
ncbi:MAG: HYR domain-containing protein, partial [Chthoniobacteraceae bacterium]